MKKQINKIKYLLKTPKIKISELKDIVRQTPNDMDLGNKIRQMLKNG
jgi:hypothetical protein